MPIGIDIEKAKEIHKEHIRAIRKPILEQKDVEYMRALEMGDQEKVTQVVTEKQELRDVTKIVTDAEISGTTVSEVTAELKQIWNEEILGTNPLV